MFGGAFQTGSHWLPWDSLCRANQLQAELRLPLPQH